MRELIIFPGALGDLICAFPAIRELIRRADGAPVELMVRAELARFAVERMGFARGHSIDRAEVGALFVDGAMDRRAAFFGEFSRVHSFFAAENQTFRTSLAAIVPEVEFYRFRPGGDGHIATAYLREIGAAVASPAPAMLQPLPEDRTSAARILSSFGMRVGNFLLIFPGSSSPAKNWPAANFIELAEDLRDVIPSLVIIGPAEAELEGLFRHGRVATISGLDLGTVAGLAAIAQGFLGNDSGVSHLAAASGMRGLVLFGPTDPARWRPLGAVEVMHAKRLEDLTVDEVRSRLLRLI